MDKVDPVSLTLSEAWDAVDEAYGSGVVTPRAAAGYVRIGWAPNLKRAKRALESLIREKKQIEVDRENYRGTNAFEDEDEDA